MDAREQLQGIMDFIGEDEARRILIFAKETFLLKPRTWEDIDEDDPLPDEVAAFAEHRAGRGL